MDSVAADNLVEIDNVEAATLTWKSEIWNPPR
jgi:hypothetical protein